MDLGRVELPPGAHLRVEVWDEDNKWDDDLLGVCEEPVEAGSNREVVCFPGGGRLQFSYRATCGPSLGGPLCHDYVPQPPEGNGWLYRFSRWPPGPGDGPVDWPNQDEEEEEEEDGLLQLSTRFAPLKKKRSRAQGVKMKTASGCSISCLFKFVLPDMQIHHTPFLVTTSLD